MSDWINQLAEVLRTHDVSAKNNKQASCYCVQCAAARLVLYRIKGK